MKRAFTTREKVMLLVLTVLLIVIAYFKLILEPINNSIDEYQSETAAEQDEILQNTALLTRMNQMQKELEEIYAAGDPAPIPNYDNSGKLLVELNSILSASVDYSLDFGQVSALNDGYIMCRPINMTFTTNTYAETRAIIDALLNSDFTNQISDISVQFENSGNSGNVQVNLYITYFELQK